MQSLFGYGWESETCTHTLFTCKMLMGRSLCLVWPQIASSSSRLMGAGYHMWSSVYKRWRRQDHHHNVVYMALPEPDQTRRRGKESYGYDQGHQGGDRPPSSTTMRRDDRRPPDDGVVKITMDGALNIADGRGGAGGVARSSSALLGAWCKPYLGISDPLIMEGLSLRDGVRFASLRGFSHVIMETDCLEMVTLWTTCHNSRSVVAPLFSVSCISLQLLVFFHAWFFYGVWGMNIVQPLLPINKFWGDRDIDRLSRTIYGLTSCCYILPSDIGLLDGVWSSQVLCADSV